MRTEGKLLAWIETNGMGEVVANFVGNPPDRSGTGPAGSDRRLPAKRSFTSTEKARAWVEAQGTMIGLPVEWLAGPPIN
jgi:hypothetical protein